MKSIFFKLFINTKFEKGLNLALHENWILGLGRQGSDRLGCCTKVET